MNPECSFPGRHRLPCHARWPGKATARFIRQNLTTIATIRGHTPRGRCHFFVPHPRQSRCQNVFAKVEVVGYTSARPTALSSTRLNWRRQGAHPLQQTHDTPRAADRRAKRSDVSFVKCVRGGSPHPPHSLSLDGRGQGEGEPPPLSRASLAALQTVFGVLGGSA